MIIFCFFFKIQKLLIKIKKNIIINGFTIYYKNKNINNFVEYNIFTLNKIFNDIFNDIMYKISDICDCDCYYNCNCCCFYYRYYDPNTIHVCGYCGYCDDNDNYYYNDNNKYDNDDIYHLTEDFDYEFNNLLDEIYS